MKESNVVIPEGYCIAILGRRNPARIKAEVKKLIENYLALIEEEESNPLVKLIPKSIKDVEIEAVEDLESVELFVYDVYKDQPVSLEDLIYSALAVCDEVIIRKKKKICSLELQGLKPDAQKITLVRIIQSLLPDLRLGIKGCFHMLEAIETVPQIINVEVEKAEKIKKGLEDAGVKVELKY